MGAVLSQLTEQGEEHPILYLSKKFSEVEKRYCTTEKECASIVFAIKRLHYYLDGNSFLVMTDHNPLVWLNRNVSSNPRLMRWALALQPYNLELYIGRRLNIDQENWVSHLLGLLPSKVSHIIAREPDKANSYEHVKDLLLKRLKLTPEKFRQLFVTYQKAPERTWIDFYHELNTYFKGWIDGLKIDTFNKLSDLIITDQLKRKTPFEFKEYYLYEWANMNSPPVQLAEKLEEFEDFKRTLKQKSSSPFVRKQEFKSTEKNRRYEAPGKFEYNRKDK
ncbi:uncharacterized protein TNCV_4765371 [Trichonephila clavipes]|nr:uncharacterized protein TNCV_4765371 [Trichonephila clavipes]